MNFIASRFGFHKLLFSLIITISLLLGGQVRAAEDEEALIQRIKEAVIKELQESGALDQQIDRGIRRFVERQAAARRAEEARQAQRAEELAKNVRPVSKERDHIRGNPIGWCLSTT